MKIRIAISLLLLLVTASILLVWWQSRSRPEMVLLFLQRGLMQAVVSNDGQIYLACTNLEVGPEHAFTVGRCVDWRYGMIGGWNFMMDINATSKNEWAGFGIGSSQGFFDMPRSSAVFVMIPHWAVAAI